MPHPDAAIKIERVKFNNFFLLVIFYGVLLVCFDLVVRNEFAFIRAKLEYQLNAFSLTIATAVIVFNALLVTFLRTREFLYSIAVLILIFFVFPSAVMLVFIDVFDYRIFLSHNLLFIGVLLFGKIAIRIKSEKLRIMESKNTLLTVAIVGLIPFVLLFLPYINLRNLFLLDIYETRALMDSAIDNVYTDYTYSWFNKFIIPCLLVFGLFFRDRITIVVGSVALIFLYLCGAHKTVFVGLIVTLALYKYGYLVKINYILKLLIGIGLFSLFVAIVFNYDYLMTMSIRRAFLLPAMVDVFYFDLFNDDPLYWSETFNGLFRTYPYEIEHSYVIGDKYLDDITWGANNGIISDGFMNFGMAGVVVNVIIIGIYISILTQLSISPKFFGLFFLFVFTILSSSLSTVMLTHGGIVLLLLGFFFLKNTDEQMVRQ